MKTNKYKDYKSFYENLDKYIEEYPNLLLGIRTIKTSHNLRVHKEDVQIIVDRVTDIILNQMQNILDQPQKDK
jgi:hypothetical protein